MKRVTSLLAVILTVCGAALPLTGRAADSTSTTVSESPRNLGDVDIRALIREVGAREHKHILWDPRLPLMLNIGALQRQEITYPQLVAILRLHAFAVTASDGVVEVIADANMRFEASPMVPPDNIKALDDEWVTTILPLKDINAVQLVTILRPLVAPNGQLGALADRNAIVIVDRSANVRRLVDIARAMEKLPAAAVRAPERAASP